MLQSEIIRFLNKHMREHHPSLQGQQRVLYIQDSNEFDELIEDVECSEDKIEVYVEELVHLELIFDYYMTNELKDEYLKTLDSVFEHRIYNYRMLVNNVVASRGFAVSFAVLGNESIVERITKIIFDVRSKVFIVEDVYKADPFTKLFM